VGRNTGGVVFSLLERGSEGGFPTADGNHLKEGHYKGEKGKETVISGTSLARLSAISACSLNLPWRSTLKKKKG